MVAPAAWAVLPGGADVEPDVAGSVTGHLGQAVLSALEPAQVVPLDRYRPPLEPTSGSKMSHHDWCV
jgi:hypothetical protein